MARQPPDRFQQDDPQPEAFDVPIGKDQNINWPPAWPHDENVPPLEFEKYASAMKALGAEVGAAPEPKLTKEDEAAINHMLDEFMSERRYDGDIKAARSARQKQRQLFLEQWESGWRPPKQYYLIGREPEPEVLPRSSPLNDPRRM